MKARVVLLVFVLLAAAWFVLRTRQASTVVVYCAHDSIYADQILHDFEKQTGQHVAVRYDTEATKSLGLTELLIREKDAPRCDVYWNNELPGTLDLQNRGLLHPYQGPGYARIPAQFKADDGSWTGFAARLRMIIVNTAKAGATPDVEALIHGDPSHLAIAKPLYGTTLTHYAALWQLWGREKVIAWHRDWRSRGVRECDGNAGVKDAVATGVSFAGFTDTDDYFEAKDAGQPVAAFPVRLENGRTICIPNTVAIIRGAKHEAAARQLVDFLLSEQTELALANSRSRQIPLGPVDAQQLPAEVRDLVGWAHDGLDLKTVGPAREECLAWLKSEYVR